MAMARRCGRDGGWRGTGLQNARRPGYMDSRRHELGRARRGGVRGRCGRSRPCLGGADRGRRVHARRHRRGRTRRGGAGRRCGRSRARLGGADRGRRVDAGRDRRRPVRRCGARRRCGGCHPRLGGAGRGRCVDARRDRWGRVPGSGTGLSGSAAGWKLRLRGWPESAHVWSCSRPPMGYRHRCVARRRIRVFSMLMYSGG